MQITLELSPDVEVRLRKSVADGDAEAVRRLLEEALTLTVGRRCGKRLLS